MLGLLQQRKLTRLFHVYDTNGNGFVEWDDFLGMIARISRGRGWPEGSPSRERLTETLKLQWSALLAGADPQGSGHVTLDGWLALWNAVLQAAYEDRVREVSELLWDAMDRDGDGRITRVESHLFFDAYGLSAAVADDAFDACDLNFDG